MTKTWDSLYLPCDDQETVVAHLREIFSALAYTLYDPFGLIPGKSYAQTVRLFVSPPHEGWIRILGRPDPRMMVAIARPLCLYLRLEDESALIETYAQGYPRDVEETLEPYLRLNAETLRQALYEDLPPPAAPDHSVMDLPDLPPDIQTMAEKVNPQQAQKMFDRISRTLTQKASAGGDATELAAQAQAMMSAPRWESFGGRRIQAVMSALTLPQNWREPDFNSLRDAYQLHVRRQRKPDARLYPGDAEVMAKVPNALDYVPVYGGCDD